MKVLFWIILILFLLYWLYKKYLGKPLLKVIVSSNLGIFYCVKTEILVPEIIPLEHVRHYLHYVTHILYILSKEQEYERKAILEFVSNCASLEKIDENSLSELVDVSLINDDGTLDINFESTLYYKNNVKRDLSFKFPTQHYRNQFEGSVKALLLCNSQILDELNLDILLEGIRYLDNQYKKGVDPMALSSIINLPFDAYWNRDRIVRRKI